MSERLTQRTSKRIGTRGSVRRGTVENSARHNTYGYISGLVLQTTLAREKAKDGLELDVARTFVDCTNLAVAPVLLDAKLAREADATAPVNGHARGVLGHLAGKVLGHCSLLDERAALLLHAGHIVDHGARDLNVSRDLGHLELHALELGDRLLELRALKRVRDHLVKHALRETDHLSADTDAALVENLNGDLVALALLADEVLGRHLDLVKVDGARARGADTELTLLLANLDAHVFSHSKGRDTLVALRRVALGKDNEEVSLTTVGDPHLRAVDDVVLAVVSLLYRRLHRKRIRARRRLRQTERAEHVRREVRHILVLELLVRVLAQHRVDERVMHVTQHRHRRVNAGKL